MGSYSNEETNGNVPNMNKKSYRVAVEIGNSSTENYDDLNDAQMFDYKLVVYKLFQYRTYKLKGSNGEFGCPFCDNYKEEHECHYTHLLLHAIRVAESEESGKHRASHFASLFCIKARFLAIDLADEVKADANLLSWSEDGRRVKKLRLDEDTNEGLNHDFLKERIYKLLESRTYKVRGPSGQLRCPFCSVEEDREYNYLLRHALVVAEGSSESAEQRAMHSALAKYLVIDLNDYAEPPPPQSTRPSPSETWERNTCQRNGEKRKENALKNLLKGAREELIKGFNDSQCGNNSSIGIKQMGELDVNVFKRACTKRFPARENLIRSDALCSMWQEKISNPQWHPFLIVEDDAGNLKKEVNEEDEVLRNLKCDWGYEVYNAVVRALKDPADAVQLLRYGTSKKIGRLGKSSAMSSHN